MEQARLLGGDERALTGRQRHGALDLARRLPALVVAARQVAASVAHGVHGRRRSGIGESFWQFRPFVHGENAAAIDWRRSARDDRAYVRERELEAAQTVWLWIDRSPSMAFVSTLAAQSKLERAVVLGLALADLLVRGGERVGLIGLTRPMATRSVIDRFADALVSDSGSADGERELPIALPLPAWSRAVLIGDALADPAAVKACLDGLSAQGATGQLFAVSDPLEETFPFEGHVELTEADGPARLRLGEARSLRDTYLRRLAEHRNAIGQAARVNGWSVIVHRTDQSAAQALLALAMRLGPDGAR